VRAVAFALVVSLAACRPAETPKTPETPPRPHVVMISIDGLRPDYLRAQETKIPTLRRLMSEGAVADGVTSVWPTVTFPAHATLVTGARPNKHGILNNLPFDPFGKNQDGWYWYARDLRVPTLWDVAKKAEYTTANVYWPVTVGARFDWSFPQIWRSKTDEDDKLVCALATPGLCDELRARFGRTPAEHRGDDARTDGAVFLLESKRPELAFVYLTDLDTVQHGYGPFSKEALAMLEAIDADVARIVAASAKETTFVIVSDHGFLPIAKVVRPSVLLRAAGLLDVESGRVKGYRAAAWKAGGLAAIMLRDPNDAASKQAVTQLFKEAASNPANGIARVYEGADIAAKGGFAGAALVLEAADGFMFSASLDGPLVEATNERGAHGYSPERVELRASLILSGAHIKHGHQVGVVDMIDVAPTVAKLLSVSLPDADGHALTDALVP
jgi:predicted AlkP superfamily pyrophosphatase or phosphodiesterase